MKILALDCENSYIIGGIWSIWNVNVSLDQMLDYGHMLCWSAKFLGSKEKIEYRRIGDRDFLKRLRELLDECDSVLTYNGKRHDIPIINREFIKNGFNPPSPYEHIDLLETVKKQFKFPSNKLQHVVTELELGSKMEHEGFQLWIKCLQEDEKAWSVMERYNKQDVRLLEKTYNKLLPWITSHPNHSVYSESTVCPNCGGKHGEFRGYYRTKTQKYRRWHCLNPKCGKWARTRFTEIDKDIRKDILI